MLRYVAIGALVGFGVAYFLLSAEPPAPVAALPPPNAPIVFPQPGMKPVPFDLPRAGGRIPLRLPVPVARSIDGG